MARGYRERASRVSSELGGSRLWLSAGIEGSGDQGIRGSGDGYLFLLTEHAMAEPCVLPSTEGTVTDAFTETGRGVFSGRRGSRGSGVGDREKFPRVSVRAEA